MSDRDGSGRRRRLGWGEDTRRPGGDQLRAGGSSSAQLSPGRTPQRAPASITAGRGLARPPSARRRCRKKTRAAMILLPVQPPQDQDEDDGGLWRKKIYMFKYEFSSKSKQIRIHA